MSISFRLLSVKTFADQVLALGRDCYGSQQNRPNTPLFADGIYLDTEQHILWEQPDSHTQHISSNLVNQQNLFRTLTGLTRLLGTDQYKNAVADSLAYHFENLQDPGGLLAMGGHRGIELDSLEPIGFSGLVHELKDALLFYDAMFEVDETAASKYIKAFWCMHVMDWQHLEISRHGDYGQSLPDGLGNESFGNPEPFRKTRGLSFLSAGNDLIYAAANLYKYTNDQNAWAWCERLANMYYQARHPKTNLGVYQYTQPLKRVEPGPGDPFYSHYGDRAQRQFGAELGADAIEGYMLLRSQASSIYIKHGLMQLDIAEQLGTKGQHYLDNVLAGMLAYQNYAYIPETNMLRPLLANGTDLTGFIVPRDGYYGPAGRVFQQFPADPCFFLAWCRAFNVTGETKLWEMITNMAKAYGLGEWGLNPKQPQNLNLKTTLTDPEIIFGLLDIWHMTGQHDYLALAGVIGDNLVKTHLQAGFFVDPGAKHAMFDDLRPLAILTLEAALDGKYTTIPRYVGGLGSSHWSRYYLR